MKAARAFRFCTSAERAALLQHACAAWRAWTTDWFGQEASPQASCDPVERDDVDVASPWLHGAGSAGSVWARADQAVPLAAALFDADPGEVASDGIAAAVGAQALSRLVAMMAAGPEDAPVAVEDRAPADLLEAGRAALCLRFEAGATLALLVELPPREASQPARSLPAFARLPAPARLTAALRGRPVTLDAWLGEADVELGALRTLAVGDVLRLNRTLAQGLELRLNDARLPCAAHPAAVGGRVAVEVARR